MMNSEFDPFPFGDPSDGDWPASSELDALAEDLAAQAQALWAHLAADEVADDEPLAFRTDDAGNLLVRVMATGSIYRFEHGVAHRARKLPTGDLELTVWQRGELVKLHLLPAEEVAAPWN